MKISPIPEGAVLDAIPDAVLVADEDLRCVHANPAALEMLGYPLDELLFIHVSDLVNGTLPWTDSDRERLEAEGSWRGRMQLERHDGSVVDVDAVVRTLETMAGRLYVSTHRPVLRTAWAAQVPALQREVTRILTKADRLDQVQPALEVIGTKMGWDVAELWVAKEDGLHLVDLWSTPDLALSDFVEQTRQRRFARGEGLPGTVWETEQPRWIAEGFDDPKFLLGRDVSAAGGLSSAFGLPLRSGDEVMGVLAAIARAKREEEPELPTALEPITGQLGQFVHRILTQDELRQSRDQLAAILSGVGDGITVQDPGGQLLYANEGAARIIGFDSAEELLSTPLPEIMNRFVVLEEDGSPMPLERLPGRRALMGEESAREVVRFRMLATGEERWSMVSASPVRDSEGRVQFAINIFQDVTSGRKREQAERFLGEVSELLASSLDYEVTLISVARLVVRGMADWCVAYINEETGLRRLEVAHADPELNPLVEELQGKYPMERPRSKAIVDVVETGRSLLFPEVPDEVLEAAAIDPERLVASKELGFRSAIAVPLPAHGQVLGVLLMISSGRRYGEDDLALAEEVGRRAGIAIDHARIYRERSHVARTLQQSLLPPELPALPGFEVAARYRPARHGIAGDFYDVYPLGKGAWGLMVGDVCGKGAEAASLTALARYTVRAASIEHRRPSEALTILNEAMLHQDLDGRFCTIVVGRIDRSGDRVKVQISSGGHPLPLLVREGGEVETVGKSGTLLGVLDDPQVADHSVQLARGDTLVLFTDGVMDDFRLRGEALEETLQACA
ncbi:MAG: SpoIIE family protein phosphatase, partial [Actinomycetota bacterium]|nr:SpoIIE family protein phosphatase [Actinomycetota bacterium]